MNSLGLNLLALTLTRFIFLKFNIKVSVFLRAAHTQNIYIRRPDFGL